MPLSDKERQQRRRERFRDARRDGRDVTDIRAMFKEILGELKFVRAAVTAAVTLRDVTEPLNGSSDKEKVPPAPPPKETTSSLIPLNNTTLDHKADEAVENAKKTPLIPNLIRSLDQEFEEIWNFFPRRVQKGQARRAYRTARKKAPFDAIVAAIKRYAAEMQTHEPRYILHPATWLNGESWLNEDKPNGHAPTFSGPPPPTGPPPKVQDFDDGQGEGNNHRL